MHRPTFSCLRAALSGAFALFSTLAALAGPSTPPASAPAPNRPAVGESWPQWRGPHRDGISRETDWESVGREESLWEADVGLGYATVSIHDGRLYTTGFDPLTGRDTVFCLDAATGAVLWEHGYPAKIWNEMHEGGTLSTPSVDGEVLYVLNREGRFSCLRTADGEVLWHQQVTERFELEPPRWGFAASPLILDDVVVLNLGRVLAVDKRKGEPVWSSPGHYGAAYSTPVDFNLGGEPCLALFNSNGLAVLDLSDGSERFFHEWKSRFDVQCATPVVVGQRLFISSGMNRGGALLELEGEQPEVLWENKTMRTKLSGCVLWEQHLYGFDEGQLKCIDLEGQEKWRQRGLGDGCLVGAGERLICLSGEGELVVVAATPEEYVELSKAKLFDDGVCWSTPVLVDGLVYCRNSKGRLVCRDHRKR